MPTTHRFAKMLQPDPSLARPVEKTSGDSGGGSSGGGTSSGGTRGENTTRNESDADYGMVRLGVAGWSAED